MWKHRLFGQNWAKSLFVILCLSFQNAANWKGKHYVYKPDFGSFTKILVVPLIDFISSIKKKQPVVYHCKTENVWLPETCVQVNGSNWFFALNLGVQRCCFHGDGVASAVHPFLQHDSNICVTYLRPSWLWVPWASTVGFDSTFQMAKWREETSCFPLRAAFFWLLTTAFSPERTDAVVPGCSIHCSSAATAPRGSLTT